VLLTERLPHTDWDRLYRQLRQSGAPFGISFGNVKLLSNARKAFEMSEYARDQGKYDPVHEQLFYAYFTRALDIGSDDVLLDIAESAGLDIPGLQQALQDGRYLPRLAQVHREAERLSITGAPTFIINGMYSIVGAQPLDVFRDTIKRTDAG